jgi:hypothetical protein
MRAPDPRTVVHRTIAPPRSFHAELTPLDIPAPPKPPARWMLPVSMLLFVAALGLFVATLHERQAGAVVVARVGR